LNLLGFLCQPNLNWLRSPAPPARHRCAWHATLMRGGDRSGGVFQPVSAAQASIQRRLMAELDPAGVFGGGRAVG
jgi:glycolate oxidase FAD binding subunit